MVARDSQLSVRWEGRAEGRYNELSELPEGHRRLLEFLLFLRHAAERHANRMRSLPEAPDALRRGFKNRWSLRRHRRISRRGLDHRATHLDRGGNFCGVSCDHRLFRSLADRAARAAACAAGISAVARKRAEHCPTGLANIEF